jgi:hypothetical protein
MGLLKYMRALFGVAVPPPPGPRRLDGRSATLLAASHCVASPGQSSSLRGLTD